MDKKEKEETFEEKIAKLNMAGIKNLTQREERAKHETDTWITIDEYRKSIKRSKIRIKPIDFYTIPGTFEYKEH